MTNRHDYTDQLDRLANLPDGWLEGEGRAVTLDAMRATRVLLDEVDHLDRASVFPIEDGGVSIEWLSHQQHTVVEVSPTGDYDTFAVRLDGGNSTLSAAADASTPAAVAAFVDDMLLRDAEAAAPIPSSLTVPDDGAPVRVVALRGLPGSGKSTAAVKAVANAPVGTVVRINNDDLVASMLGGPDHGAGNVAALLASIRRALLTAALADPSVRLIIVDNTNLALRTVHELHQIAAAAGAEFIVDDTFLDVPVEECVARDARRGRRGGRTVGEDVLTRMARQASRLPRPYRAPASVAYAGLRFPAHDDDPTLPSTVIVDIDGTLALMGDRSPFDWARVGEDAPNPAVVAVVRALIAAGHHITVMSGRDGVAYEATAAWLAEHVAPGLPLHMRAAGDTRPDFVVKHELFQEHIAGKYSVLAVIDDRDQVIDLWRRQLGLPTFQVADGAF